jgi:hypothetical protein
MFVKKDFISKAIEKHGNRFDYSNVENPINKIVNKTFKELYQKTIEKENFLKSNGYKVITIWESDFNKIYKWNYL